jgi:hypothetical protein
MGQDVSHPSLQLQRVGSVKHTHNLSGSKSKHIQETKILQIFAEEHQFFIEINDDTLTCGWLLSEAIRLYKGNLTLVGLRTAKNLEALDYWLMSFERSLQPFKNKEQLIALFQDPTLPIGPLMFSPIKYIGKGGFSKVIEVRKKDTGMLYAIKITNKEFLISEDKVHQILTEKRILQKTSSPFVVKMHWAYQTVL